MTHDLRYYIIIYIINYNYNIIEYRGKPTYTSTDTVLMTLLLKPDNYKVRIYMHLHIFFLIVKNVAR